MSSSNLNEIGIMAHIGSGGFGVAKALFIQESMKHDLGVIIVDEPERGVNITNLVEMKVKETQQALKVLSEHVDEYKPKEKTKKPFWKDGKLRYK